MAERMDVVSKNLPVCFLSTSRVFYGSNRPPTKNTLAVCRRTAGSVGCANHDPSDLSFSGRSRRQDCRGAFHFAARWSRSVLQGFAPPFPHCTSRQLWGLPAKPMAASTFRGTPYYQRGADLAPALPVDPPHPTAAGTGLNAPFSRDSRSSSSRRPARNLPARPSVPAACLRRLGARLR